MSRGDESVSRLQWVILTAIQIGFIVIFKNEDLSFISRLTEQRKRQQFSVILSKHKQYFLNHIFLLKPSPA